MQKITPRTLALSLEYHLFRKDKALLKPFIPPRVQSMLRRRARAKYLIWDARRYHEWMNAHLLKRAEEYRNPLQPGLLSVATPVWDGTPVPYLRLLAKSIADQNVTGACEWFVLDNGCKTRAVRQALDLLAREYSWVTLHRNEKNEGIVGGLRACLENARNRYLCVVDSDDLLYPDCLPIVQSWIRQNNFPALLYSDEDKIIGTQTVQPYFKPDFDPVLLLNSAYIAHLGVVERDKAIDLKVYTDRNAEGSADWDCFVRFYSAGYQAVHIPEVIYSWRMHPDSTADDAGSKPYIHSSQQAVLKRYLELNRLAENNVVKYSPLLPGTADWWIERQHLHPMRALLVSENAQLDYPGLTRKTSAQLEDIVSENVDMICLLLGDLQPVFTDCLWEAQGLFERFPDAVMVGGWIEDDRHQVQDGPLVLGFDGGCGCPDQGRAVVDPGYFTQMRKQRSVSAVSSRFAVIRSEFLREAFESGAISGIPLDELGPWLGRYALAVNRRIIFSPFFHCKSRAHTLSPPSHPFCSPPDHRYYPRNFATSSEAAYQLKLRE